MISIFSFQGFSQSKQVLIERISTLTARIDAINAEIQLLKEQNKNQTIEIEALRLKISTFAQSPAVSQPNSNENPLKSVQEPANSQNTAKRCIAITAAGAQCSRNAEVGSEYCWQHRKSAESSVPSITNQANPTTKSSYQGHEIQTGPRGGKYYINSKGNKTYIKK